MKLHIDSICSTFRATMLLLYLFLTIPTHAIRDTNQNAVSDLWERKNNSGNLMVDFDPTADPDGDGWTNEQEAVTGTNPLDANAPVGFIRPHIEYIPAVYITPEVEGGEPEILSPEITTITWPTLAGKLYTLFASTDLSPGSWTTIGTPNLGRGTEIAIAISLSQSDGGIPERLFLRVSVLDIDQDSDTLTNAEEAELGSLPYSADGDNDGLNDLEELFTYQTHPVSRDSDGDGVSDPDEILVNFTNPLTAADADGDGIPDDFEKYFAKQLLVYQADSSAWGTYYAGLVAGNLNATYDYTGDGMSVRELAEILKKIAAAGPAASGYHLEQQGRRNSIPWAYYFSSSSSSSSEGIYSHSVPNDYDVRISITPTADLSSQYLLSRIDGVPWSGSYITPGDQMNFFNGMVESAFRSTPVMSPNGTKFQGRISQQRSRLVATHPGHEAYSKTYLKVVENSHYFTYDHNGVITVEPITVEVPKGKMLSDWCEFKAPVVSESDGRSAELRLLQVDIEPDANMAGVVGDVVKSAKAGSTVEHFVTPKKSTELNQDYVELKAVGIDTATFNQLLEWEGGESGSTADKRKVKRDAAGKTEVKIKVKQVGTVAAQMNVWVVWATGVSSNRPFTVYNDGGTSSNIIADWDFIWTLHPQTMFSDSDRPDLSGANNTPPPNGNKKHVVSDFPLAGGADKKWDVSRQARFKVINPHLYTKPQLAAVPGKYFDNQPVAVDVPEDFPSNPVEGNDDTQTDDEYWDPYSSADLGKLKSTDKPSAPMKTSTGASLDTWEERYHFREFVRVEINSKWYKMSEDIPWRIHFKYKRLYFSDGKTIWYNYGSEQGADNNGF